MSNQTEVATKVEELSTALNTEVEDLTITISDGGFSNTVIDGEEIAAFLSEAEEEQTPTESEDTTEGGDDEEDTSEAGDEVDIHFEEMDYKDLQKLASEELDEYPSDHSKSGLVDALSEAEISDISSADENDIEDVEEDDDTTEGGENDEDTPLHPDEAENPTKENYVFHFGVCDSDDCSYGTANEESDYCASCKKKHSSKSKTSNKSSSEKTNATKVEEVEDLYDLSRIEAEAVVFQVSEGNYDSHSEAVKNHL